MGQWDAAVEHEHENGYNGCPRRRKEEEKAFEQITTVNFPQLLKTIAYISRKITHSK